MTFAFPAGSTDVLAGAASSRIGLTPYLGTARRILAGKDLEKGPR
jgi:hypothetical protein